MGTPAFAVPSLNALVEASHDVCGAFTQPDRPKNRGMKRLPTPVKECCALHGIPVFQPDKLRDGAAMEQIRALAPELIVVAAYGRILPDDILAYPPLGCINVHSSLLPKYRGAAPINWAILNGEDETGVTIMHMAAELDAGDIIAQERTPIGPDETAAQLYDRLALLGAGLLRGTVEEIGAGRAGRTSQDHAKATLAPMLSRALSPMDWTRPARELHNQARGLTPWPGATTELNGVPCKVLATRVLDAATQAPPGTVLSAGKDGIHMACGDGQVLSIDVLQASGGRRMGAADYLRGHPIDAGAGPF
ncbi:MAG: methionyl-tRNA formyltransferase [Clostridiales bacterium]|nr:methionyl-tRNA formyltransferase [Clostridiales bacterium]